MFLCDYLDSHGNIFNLFMVTIFNIFLVMPNVSWIITTTYSSWSVKQLFTSFDREWARDGVLCLLLFNGRAAMVAFLSHRGQVSVGEGLRLPTAWSNVWNRNHIELSFDFKFEKIGLTSPISIYHFYFFLIFHQK